MLRTNAEHQVPPDLMGESIAKMRGDRQAETVAGQCQLADEHYRLICGFGFIARRAGDSGIFEPAFLEDHLAIHDLQRAVEKIHRRHADEPGYETVGWMVVHL